MAVTVTGAGAARESTTHPSRADRPPPRPTQRLVEASALRRLRRPSSTATTPPSPTSPKAKARPVSVWTFFPRPGLAGAQRLGPSARGRWQVGQRTGMNAGDRGLVDELQLRADSRPRPAAILLALTRPVLLAMIKRRPATAAGPAIDLLPHVPSELGDHGVLEWGLVLCNGKDSAE